MDKVTQERISKLHPSVRVEMAKIIDSCNQALQGKAQVRITQGLRTIEEQNDLYAIGRSKKGKKVTNAKGGESIHNYGFAVDICLIIDGKTASWDTAKDWDNDQIADWMECVKIFALHGWVWGGSWIRFKDMPHFEKKNLTWRQLAKLAKDTSGYVKYETK